MPKSGRQAAFQQYAFPLFIDLLWLNFYNVSVRRGMMRDATKRTVSPKVAGNAELPLSSLLTFVLISLVCLFLAAVLVPAASAEQRQRRPYPYGGGQSGSYGQKRGVTTVEEAKRSLKTYFSKQEVRIGEVREKEHYFEADILKKNGDQVIDTVIIDKRTGRIRSIY